MLKVRQPTVAGSFYPSDSNELKETLKGFIDNATYISKNKIVKALIVPHAGYVFSGTTAGWGYKQIGSLLTDHSSQKNNSFVIIGPSHNFGFEGIVGNDFEYWETPLGKVKHEKPIGKIELFNEAFVPEHNLEVQIPFIQFIDKDAMISCFLTGITVDTKEFADYFIQNYPDSVYIFSSDLSHYLSEDEARMKDRKTIEAILRGDNKYFKEEENTACGSNGIRILMDMARQKKWKTELIYYDTSASYKGDSSKVVGYVAVSYF